MKMPLRRLAANLSLILSPASSRSNCANGSRMFNVNLHRSGPNTGRWPDHGRDVPARTAGELRKRLDVARAAERWLAQLPALIEQQLRSE
jgi:hypothetical protein